MYAKVFAQIYDGTLCTKGPWQALVTFQQLLVLADQEGVVDMTASAIARRTTIPLEIIEEGLKHLLLPDPESRTPTEGGRRIVPLAEGRAWGWLVVNYKHYRALKREADRREYHRDYWHKRQLNNSTATQHAQPTQPNQPIAYAEAEAKTKTKTKTARNRAASESLVSVDDLPLISIPLADGSDHAVAASSVAEWSGLFPAVNVLQQLRQMRAWCIANPTRKKTSRGVNAFVVAWLGRVQDSGRTVSAAVAGDPFSGAH